MRDNLLGLEGIGVVVLFGVICGGASSVKNYAVGMKESKSEEEVNEENN